ncbi:SGNH/GDSL hydrolase family protein [Bacillus taeanensis]|uniref:Hydrolase n=1 Tax=Bacillus taeanensis TaxID=273032 RepID=A0A366XYG9_9BACI|nr:SGNH/GDSL hydrolase family protein [Bacillus taeanensis]RBW70666.1 hydrolase [Bacillus taeanensis]
MRFQSNERILLIGDSITDADRRQDPEEIGYGYTRLIRDYYTVTYPQKNLSFVNKGVGGNRVTDLAARWKEDVLTCNPDWLSVSIGINDVWRQLDNPQMEQVYPEDFEKVYYNLLKQVKAQTKAKIILMEPTIIEEKINSDGNRMLIPYVKVVHRLAETFDAVLVPTHEVFINFLQSGQGIELTTDGVHMTSVGNMLMAQTWIKTLS